MPMHNVKPVEDTDRAWAQEEWDSVPLILEELGLEATPKVCPEGHTVYDLVNAPVRLTPAITSRGDLATSVACEVVSSVFGLGTVSDLPLRPPA